MSRFTKVLRNRDFSLLWLSQIISQLGDRLSQMALIGLVPGSTWQIAKILSFTLIPVFLIGPIAGAYVDRWDRRKTMFICDSLRACLVLTIPLLFLYNKFIGIYIVIFVVFSLGRFFIPAKLAIVPELVAAEDLVAANSLVNTTGMIAAVLGFGISGLIVEKLGAKAGFYLDGLSFIVSAGLLFFISKKNRFARIDIKKTSQEIVGAIKKTIGSDIKESIFYVWKNKEIRFTAGVMFALFAALGSVYVVAIVFIQKTLHSATKDLGLLIMFLGLGLFTGSLIYGHCGHKLSHYKTIFTSLILSGIMLVAFALGISRYPVFIVAAVLSLCLGMSISPIMIASNTIVHNVSANHMMGKVFSSLEIVMHLGFLTFMFISSKLADKLSHTYILVAVGCIIALLGIINLIVHHKISWLD
ncbi:MAG: MFS transporter [Candidatus Omnitrophica bacterium]|jgi:MFS family permease|nr:MFS transporter [Candidatus Omnitrophota bacterium]MDD5079607.1 MFS transporter [Candidatus Omnitrophota bacterium]